MGMVVGSTWTRVVGGQSRVYSAGLRQRQNGPCVSSETTLSAAPDSFRIFTGGYRFCEGTYHLTWIESQLHQLLTASAKGRQAAPAPPPAPPLDIPDLGSSIFSSMRRPAANLRLFQVAV